MRYTGSATERRKSGEVKEVGEILAIERRKILTTERREIFATERRGGARLRRSAAPMQHMSVCGENRLTSLFLLVVLLIILVTKKQCVDKMITDCGNTTQDVEHWADDASKMQIWFPLKSLSSQPSAGTWRVAGEQERALRSPDRDPPASLTAITIVTTRTMKVGSREAG